MPTAKNHARDEDARNVDSGPPKAKVARKEEFMKQRAGGLVHELPHIGQVQTLGTYIDSIDGASYIVSNDGVS